MSPGKTTSIRRPLTSTVIGLRASGSASSPAPPEKAGIVLLNSVSIQRVWTENGVAASAGAKAGSLTTARWKVSAVAMPSISNSASARRERSRASWRSRPVTISFANRESKLPPITSPLVKPESRRTPGPLGGFQTVSEPGAGKKPRPGSSPLMRNSMEWPRSSGSP